MFDSYELAQPSGLWLLALPILLLLLLRLNTSPPVLATGTLHLWKRIAATAKTDGRRRKRRVPLSIWLLVLGLCAGALAVADPRPVQAAGVQRFVCVVDSSASMYLPLGASTRIERAGQLAREWLDREASDRDEIAWVRTVDGLREEIPGANLPGAWQSAPRSPQPTPRWSDFDRPGTLWLTDDAGELQGAAAALIATGGAAVPGPVATFGTARFDWDGEELVRVEGGAALGTLRWDSKEASALAPEVLAFAQVWAADRGLLVNANGGNANDAEERLVLRAGSGEAEPVVLAREGWRFEGFASVLAGSPAESTGTTAVWLSNGAADYVRFRPGLIECGLSRVTKLGGDPASFAVSWAELFDRAVLPSRSVIALEERFAAGEEVLRAPEVAARPETVRAGGILPAAWLACLAFLCVALGSALGLRSRRLAA